MSKAVILKIWFIVFAFGPPSLIGQSAVDSTYFDEVGYLITYGIDTSPAPGLGSLCLSGFFAESLEEFGLVLKSWKDSLEVGQRVMYSRYLFDQLFIKRSPLGFRNLPVQKFKWKGEVYHVRYLRIIGKVTRMDFNEYYEKNSGSHIQVCDPEVKGTFRVLYLDGIAPPE